MLSVIRVQNFAIIDALELELGRGLNVVTGETGAGKSILVDALGLVLGEKAKPEIIRTGAEQAEVEALFSLEDDPALRARLEAAGIPADDELIVRRIVSSNGRSRAFLNGRLATARELGEIARGLADISSQHEHHSLTDPSTHLLHLDAFAELEVERKHMTSAYEAVVTAKVALDDNDGDERKRAEREDLLRFQLREIDEAALTIDEETKVREEHGRLKHASKLCQLSTQADEALYSGDDAIATMLARVSASVFEGEKLDASLTPLRHELEEVRSRLEEVARSLGKYARGIHADPDRLVELDERLDRIQRIKRKYGGDIEAVLAFRAEAAAELESLVTWESRRAERAQAYESALEQAVTIATRLSEARRAAATKLGKSITKELQSLGMGGALVRVAVSSLESRADEIRVSDARLSSTGIDRVELLIAPNRGEDPRPLRKIASGGELSRALLAIKRVLGGLGPAGLYVFDEVDSGIGGGIAEVIGRKMKDVAEHHQVLCITHLPQIAVFADKHFCVAKDFESGRTVSRITELSGAQRREEIARMIGGLTITAKTRAAASEMLRLAC